MILIRLKLLAGVAAFALVSLSLNGNEAYAAATVCANTAAATIDVGNCTVAGGLIPTTVVFQDDTVDVGALGSLILNGAAPTGAVTNTVDGEGAVSVTATV